MSGMAEKASGCIVCTGGVGFRGGPASWTGCVAALASGGGCGRASQTCGVHENRHPMLFRVFSPLFFRDVSHFHLKEGRKEGSQEKEGRKESERH